MKPDILAVGKLAPTLEEGLRQAYTFHERLPESDVAAGSAIAKKFAASWRGRRCRSRGR